MSCFFLSLLALSSSSSSELLSSESSSVLDPSIASSAYLMCWRIGLYCRVDKNPYGASSFNSCLSLSFFVSIKARWVSGSSSLSGSTPYSLVPLASVRKSYFDLLACLFLSLKISPSGRPFPGSFLFYCSFGYKNAFFQWLYTSLLFTVDVDLNQSSLICFLLEKFLFSLFLWTVSKIYCKPNGNSTVGRSLIPFICCLSYD